MDDCDIPAGWKCVKETKVRYNGFSWWKTGECGLGTHTAGTPRNPRPDDQGDPRWRLTCQQTKLPSLAVMVNSTHAAVHEFGHGVVLHDWSLDNSRLAEVRDLGLRVAGRGWKDGHGAGARAQYGLARAL